MNQVSIQADILSTTTKSSTRTRKHSGSNAPLTCINPPNSKITTFTIPSPSHPINTRPDEASSPSTATMCVEITYIYPHCGCISRMGRYACYHASHIAKTGFSLCCERYKTTAQDTRTGDPACAAHLKLGKVKKRKKSKKEEDVEGSDGMGVEGEEKERVMMSGAVQGVSEGEGRGCESEGEGDMEHGEMVIGISAEER